MRAPLHLALIAATAATVAAAGEYPDYNDFRGKPYTVEYDGRSLILNGTRSLFLSGCIHYPRATPSAWDDLLRKTKEDGLNSIETYVFWNAHEHKRGVFDFSEHRNLTLFLDKAVEHGLFVNLRLGPFVCAEWNYGGFPVWINRVPGLSTRTYNQPWLELMANFTQRFVDIARPYLASNGGPVYIMQVENEYMPRSEQDLEYVAWCGKLADRMKADLPWEMCNGASANNTINTCNGNDCTGFIKDHGQNGHVLVDQPAMWTENEGWFQSWAQPYPYRPENEISSHPFGWWSVSRDSDELAFSVARWVARGGSHMNYYMYVGGNHFGASPGSALTTWYANDVNFNADGLPNEPKRTHLNRLHVLLARVAPSLMQSPAQMGRGVPLPSWNATAGRFQNSTWLLAFEYTAGPTPVVFLESSFADGTLLTQYKGVNFTLAPSSVLVLDGNTLAVAYNTSDVPPAPAKRVTKPLSQDPMRWQSWTESMVIDATPAALAAGRERLSASLRPYGDPTSTVGAVVQAQVPLEQVNVTEYDSVWMLYQTHIGASDLAGVLGGATEGAGAASGTVNLTLVSSQASAVTVFVDGQRQADAYEATHGCEAHTFEVPVSAQALERGARSGAGVTLSILSESLGIDNLAGVKDGVPSCVKGLVGSVTLGGANLTANGWTMRSGLHGEALEVYTAAGQGRVSWSDVPASAGIAAGTWLRTQFATPDVATQGGVVLFDASGFSRGRFYVNGYDLGRIWTVLGFNTTEPSQRYYYIPPDWMSPVGQSNDLVVVDTVGAEDVGRARVAVSMMVPV